MRHDAIMKAPRFRAHLRPVPDAPNTMRHDAIMKALAKKSADDADRDLARLPFAARQSMTDEQVGRLRYRSGDS